MNFSRKGLVLAVLQVVLVVSVAAKFSIDRARYPKIWVKTQSIDPYLPIRGRYIAMRLTVNVEGAVVAHKTNHAFFHARLYVKNGRLTAEEAPSDESTGIFVEESRRAGNFRCSSQFYFFCRNMWRTSGI